MTTNNPIVQTPSFTHSKFTSQRRRVEVHLTSTLKNISIACSIYITGFLLLGLLSASDLLDEQFTLVGLHLIAAISFYSYWKREPWGTARYGCFGSAILLLSMGFRLLFCFDTLIYDTRFDAWPATVSVDSSLINLFFKGEAITFFGTLIMVASWRLCVRESLERLTFFGHEEKANINHFKTLYIFGCISQILLTANVGLGSFVQLFGLLRLLSDGCVYFLAHYNVKSKSRTCILKAFLLGLPLSFFALTTGVKSEILIPLIPATIIAWRSFSSGPARVFIIVFGIVSLSIVNIFVAHVRNTSWNEGETYSATELTSGAFASNDRESLKNSTEAIMSRINLSSSHALTVAIAERDGYIPMEIFGGIPASFIPRLIWPDKPILRPGNDHTQRIRGSSINTEDVNTSTAPCFFTELYLGGGVFGLILVSVLYGFVLGWIQLNFITLLPSSATSLFNFIMYITAIRFDENTISYALTGLVLNFILIHLIFKVLLLLPSRTARR